jgi:protein-disulfide isomerase
MKRTPVKTRPWRRVALAVIGLFVATGIVWVGVAAQNAQSASPAANQAPQPAATSAGLPDMARRLSGDPTALGKVDAPVVLVEYADFRCPFCGIYARETLPLLIKEYVDTGKLRIEWRDMVVYGQESMDAAVAARAAGQQGLFWQYSAAVYAGAPEHAHADLTRAKLIEIARQVGVPDLASFEKGFTDAALIAAVNADGAEGQALGVSGTPTFLVNDTPVIGAQPIEAFRAAIDAQLAMKTG